VIRAVNASGVEILFVGLGCPKQERWMAAHRGKIQAVMLGVGAAFDFHSGAKRQAPLWMQRSGLEWLFRFSQEPTRLWRRYLVQNPRFVILILMRLLSRRM
jgi:N-acetylglucosaminyldiphosphoundecaprenol N-acetyl-beta-D-mannosaminyltransferase